MVLLQTNIKRVCSLLHCSLTEVISEGLNGYFCKPPWSEAGEKKQSEISTHRNYTYLLLGDYKAEGAEKKEDKRFLCNPKVPSLREAVGFP